jgi:condensin complex subunit 1
VRYNTLMVITHLVLNDMIKVKGQVSHVAHSLNDPDEAIAELAKLFFIKLSERSNNPVYNLLGDIIGIFSQDQGSMEKEGAVAGAAGGAVTDMPVLSREQFQSTMHFLLSFVQKDK